MKRLFLLFLILLLAGCATPKMIVDLDRRIEALEDSKLEEDLDAAAGVGASSKLSDLTELAAIPADSDEIYINDGGVSKKIQVSNLVKALHTLGQDLDVNTYDLNNVGSIDSEGNTDPQLPFRDSDAAGADDADEVSCTLYSNLTTTTEDAEYGDFWIECVINGTHTEVIRFDASDNAWETDRKIDSSAGIEAMYIDAGIKSTAQTGDYDLSSSTVCYEEVYATGSGAVQTITAPDSGLCDTDVGSTLRAMDRNNTYALQIKPNATDYIILPNGTTCTQGQGITNNSAKAAGDFVVLRGRTDGTWVVWENQGTWTCYTP